MIDCPEGSLIEKTIPDLMEFFKLTTHNDINPTVVITPFPNFIISKSYDFQILDFNVRIIWEMC